VIVRFLISNAYASGGTVRTTLNMASELANRHSVEVVSVFHRREHPLYPLDSRVRLRPLATQLQPTGGGFAGDARRRAQEWASTQPSRVIHAQDSRHALFNGLDDVHLIRFLRSVRDGVLIATRPGLNLAMARYARRSVVRIAQEHLHLDRHRPRLRAAIQRQYPKLDAVTALTEDDAGEYRRLLEDKTRVVRMPNAVPDLGPGRAQLDNKVVIAAGRLTGQKGFDRLIPAFAKVATKHPEWQLRIFGQGKNQRQLQRQIKRLGVGGNVTLMGYTEQLPAEMADSSIYAMSSRFEGFPMVMLEAMSRGLPVVTFDFPTGAKDLVDDGVHGVLVPAGDVKGLAAGIMQLIEDDTRRKAFGAAALAKAGQYETPALGRRWDALLDELVAAKAAARRGSR
jgi:glycosyltransferase involved in cell wall biosynthesis